ncbi:NAD-dependent epimerase/dehydratase family protein [Pseudomonas poae]|nr:NAD-dependent epimerase/dehydratase family protein [Pseudomonas poae]
MLRVAYDGACSSLEQMAPRLSIRAEKPSLSCRRTASAIGFGRGQYFNDRLEDTVQDFQLCFQMRPLSNVLLTGATGFVGSALLAQLLTRADHSVTIASRAENPALEHQCRVHNLGKFGAETLWHDALADIDCVVHVAGRAHVFEQEHDALELFRQANTHATLNLARQSAASGVKRFIFISSIGVNGAFTTGAPFSEDSVPSPSTDYALSKYEAETGLMQIADATEMEVVIIRPPLVYAAHAPGNFWRLLKLVGTGVPLPFGRVRNSRSMIALENLVDLIIVCISHPAAANQIFLASDGEDLSTGQLVTCLAQGMGRGARLLPVSVGLLRILATLAGKQGIFTQLCGSLQIDSSKAVRVLGWTPPLSAGTALKSAGKKFIERVAAS